MDSPACAVGQLRPGGHWLGFTALPGDRYALVVGGPNGARHAEADTDALLALAIVYFEEALDPPPDELAATHADIAGLVRHLAAVERDPPRQGQLTEAVDAVDDGLAADAVISRLVAALRETWTDDPVGRLVSRARELSGDD